MNLPSCAQRIPDLLTLKSRVGPCSHIAMYKPLLKIYHHYLVKEVHFNSIVIFYNDKGLYTASSGFDRIMEGTIEFTAEGPFDGNIEYLNLKPDVYLIERQGYPITADEKVKVFERATNRLVEKNFSFSSSNSEWFVIWALTGVDECREMEKGVGNITTVGGGVGGVVIGQMLIPVPIVGGLLGGIFGGWLGRRTGKLHDHEQEERRKQALIDKAVTKQCNE